MYQKSNIISMVGLFAKNCKQKYYLWRSKPKNNNVNSIVVIRVVIWNYYVITLFVWALLVGEKQGKGYKHTQFDTVFYPALPLLGKSWPNFE